MSRLLLHRKGRTPVLILSAVILAAQLVVKIGVAGAALDDPTSAKDEKDGKSVYTPDEVALIKKLKDSDAKSSISACEMAILSAQEEADKQVSDARKKLLADLETAQSSATKAKQLDEAILIRNISKAIENGNDPKAAIEIITAVYGANTSWLDVTDKVRKAVGNKANWSATVRTKDFGEPAPGFAGPRALIVRFRVNGKIRLTSNYEDKEIDIVQDEADLIKKLKDPDAKKAISAWDKVSLKSKEERDKQILDARKKLLADLGVTLASAIKANQQDEALVIRELSKAIENDNSPKTGIEIISALYGANVSFIDVTDKVRKDIGKQTKWSATVRTKDLGEPAPEFTGTRTLIVQYRMNGKTHLARSSQDKEIKIPEK
jgi:hypothetical protein